MAFPTQDNGWNGSDCLEVEVLGVMVGGLLLAVTWMWMEQWMWREEEGDGNGIGNAGKGIDRERSNCEGGKGR